MTPYAALYICHYERKKKNYDDDTKVSLMDKTEILYWTQTQWSRILTEADISHFIGRVDVYM